MSDRAESEQMDPRPDQLPINCRLSIPFSELGFRFSRAGGPGGQHVNKTETRVELLFDVASSPTLSTWQRRRLLENLASYIDADGILHLSASSERSQLRNRQAVIWRFRSLLAGALLPKKSRIPTQPHAAARERRLAEKRERSLRKRARSRPPSNE